MSHSDGFIFFNSISWMFFLFIVLYLFIALFWHEEYFFLIRSKKYLSSLDCWLLLMSFFYYVRTRIRKQSVRSHFKLDSKKANSYVWEFINYTVFDVKSFILGASLITVNKKLIK